MAEIRKDILWRMGLLYFLLLAFSVIITGRVLFLQIIEGSKWKSKANELTQKDIIIEPLRGDIYSDNGKVLASSVPFYEVRFDAKVDELTSEIFFNNVDSLALCLHKLFKDKPAQEYKNVMLSAWRTGNRYQLIKRKVTYSQLREMRKFPIFRMGTYKGGMIVMQTNRRVKPFGMLASRTIGYVTNERVVVGIEGAFDKYLKGKQGVELVQKIAGNVWMPVNNGKEVEPMDGFDVFTTIDVNFQDIVHNALLRQLSINNAHHGSVILMEVETGYIRAIANLEKISENSEYTENYNYAIGESTEPGSTFKLISMLVALEEGVVDIGDTINTGNGIMYYHDRKMKDSHEGGYGRIAVKDVFAFSSNVGVSKIITHYFNNDPNKFINRLYKLKLNETIGLDIKGEGKPLVKDPSDSTWSGVSLPWISIGYEIKLTPLQILSVYNAIANNGMMMKPKLVKELRYHGETIKTFHPEVVNSSICSGVTLKKLKIMLESVVEYGTAKNLKGAMCRIAGKTGTAQIANTRHGYLDENANKSYLASFAGYFPADNPRYSCIVVISSPTINKGYYGNVVAGPVFKEIADKIYATDLYFHKPVNLAEVQTGRFPVCMNGYKEDLSRIFKSLKVPANIAGENSNWVTANYAGNNILLKNTFYNNGLMPDVTGMGLRDALYLLENNGIQVRVTGKGSVKSQSLAPGTKLENRQIVYIELG